MRDTQSLLALAAFAIAAVLCYLGAVWGVNAVQTRSAEAVHHRLSLAGLDWVKLRPDGLLLYLSGTAPTEAQRFRAIAVAGTEVDPSRLIDTMQVTPPKGIEAPRFSVELLRNENGISLIGLVPTATGHDSILAKVDPLAAQGKVTDMLETADYPEPADWAQALQFGLAALAKLPRSKISIAAGRVSVTAITDSRDAKRQLESDLARMAPQGVKVVLDISAPRPVITPFTLRFLIDDNGARFDACSADTVTGRDLILAAARSAGAEGKLSCTVGLGVPSPDWDEAAVQGIEAVKALGDASITFSDTDVTLLAGPDVKPALFDRVVGDLGANLPDVFSLKAKQAPKASAKKAGPVEFTATLSPEGQVQLRGRLGSELTRQAVTSYAEAAFPERSIYNAARLDPNLPGGWPVRVLAGIHALSVLHNGALVVRADTVQVSGVSGNKDASDEISRILSDKLGQGQAFDISVKYDKRLDKMAGLPSPQACVDGANAILKGHQVTFAPGSDKIDASAGSVMDQLADALRNCAAVPIEVAGYTDNQGSAAMNLALSQKRAEAVLSGLLARRVPIGNFHAKGYGEADPIADNATEAGREANRRIEFSLIAKQGDDKAAGTAEGTDKAAAGTAAGTAGGETTTDQTADQTTDQTTDQSADQKSDQAAPQAGDGTDQAAPDPATIQGSGDATDGTSDGSADAGAAGASDGADGQNTTAPTAGESVRPKLRPGE